MTPLLLFPTGAGVVARQASLDIESARFRADVAHNAGTLAAAGCRRGLLVADDGYWAAVGLFALLHAGAEAIIPPNAQPGTLAALDGRWDHVVDHATGTQGQDRVILASAPSAVEDAHRPSPRPVTGALPVIFFTSGSTGAPKEVRRDLAALSHEAAAIHTLLGSRVPGQARVHATVSALHMYGLAFRLCWPLWAGRPFIAETHAFWEGAYAALAAGDVLVTSPSHLARMGGLTPLPRDQRPSLVLSAGAPLSDADAAVAADLLGVPVTEIFGSTETGAIAYRERSAPDPVWRALPGLTITPTADGLLSVQGPQIGATAHIGTDILVPASTADNPAGFRLGGRADRVVKIEGKRVGLAEMEEQLRRSPLVATAAILVLGSNGSIHAPSLAAVVVLTPDGQACRQDEGDFRFWRRLRRHLAETQAAAVLPRRWRAVDTLPEGPMGKRRQNDLLRLFQDAPAASGPTVPDIREVHPQVGGVDIVLTVPADLLYLQGHFPNAPIVPGVALLDWVVSLARQHLGVPLPTGRSFQIKFRRVVLPDMVLTLALRLAGNRRKVTFEYREVRDILASGTINIDQQANIDDADQAGRSS